MPEFVLSLCQLVAADKSLDVAAASVEGESIDRARVARSLGNGGHQTPSLPSTIPTSNDGGLASCCWLGCPAEKSLKIASPS
ncbi:hypothetical protein EC9_51440 [Rosistilla ulvae]|uniref:Uncharacterized protein n=1 Tax=Rosistilla ulvae TaxID=1930277 RepID=A0A517M7R9_9BACT|nr:hypothetical protein EC9_51440 [Rosistilla ulvae]